ncbi:MAG TPA: hypothetical protein PKM27_04605 [Saprospiraceae bacterium]|nr:hypothetical protein [Saprospiraceae bacterium]HNT19312.1 hypothetical protein [Saprospiraceae bacterium]
MYTSIPARRYQTRIIAANNLARVFPVLILIFFLTGLLRAQSACPLNCNDQINISLDENCQRILVPDDVLENPDSCQNAVVSLTYPYGTHSYSSPLVDRTHLGYTIIYRVTDTVNRNSCWGYILVEDKFPPQPVCKSIEISCFQLARFNDILGKVQDNCSQVGKAVISALYWVEYGCDSAFLGRVFRTIRTYDQWGNSSLCMDTLRIRKDSLHHIKCPDHLQLNCRINCEKPGGGPELIQFSPDPGHPFYPSPEFLLQLQERDTFGSNTRTCIPRDSMIVPGIRDILIVAVLKNTPFPAHSGLSGLASSDTCVALDTCVNMWTTEGSHRGGLCKISLGYKDHIVPVCGSGFKIRREWKIADWCAQRDTVCVQYIKIEDQEAPVITGGRTRYYSSVKAHDCFVPIPLEALQAEDCDPVLQTYYLEYADGDKGKKIVLNGTLPASLNLTARGGINGKRCFEIRLALTDPCLNKTETLLEACISDLSPPTPLCDESAQVTVDPATCWARVYAKDLDNGSRDNCCNLLHFAVAPMSQVESTRAQAISKIETVCGRNEYWGKKAFYDAYIENWINCYVFNDYVDLTECGNVQLVLRVYEACGIPLYDPHTFPCSPHDWFCYNTSHLFRAEFNFNWFDKHDKWFKDLTPRNCDWAPPVFCGDSLYAWLTHLKIRDHDKKEGFPGSIEFEDFRHFRHIFYLSKNCLELDFTPDYVNKMKALTVFEPGNTCSKNLYHDCMVRVAVADKTPPVCEKPKDLTVYCDGQSGNYTYAQAKYWSCSDGKEKGKWPYAIECRKEGDGDLSDATDPTGKPFGYYGGPILVYNHDDHGPSPADCEEPYNTWKPVYCKQWLCLDSLDTGRKTDYKSFFSKAIFKNGGKPAEPAGSNAFYIWDNCQLDTAVKIEDTEYLDPCGAGWLKRTWTVTDRCGNKTICDQKINAVHRSDFEVLFPPDVVISCMDSASLYPGLDQITGQVMIMDDECELVGVNYEDTRYDIVVDGCYKIVRKWTLIDWCKYDPLQKERAPDIIVNDSLVADKNNRACVIRNLKDDGDGYMVYTQIIKVVDELAPVLTCKDSLLCTYVDGCKERFSFSFSATDNCTPSGQIGYKWELDAGGDGTIEKRSIPNVKNFSEELASGQYRLTVYATDHCGNYDTCVINLTVKDCKQPTPYCFNGISTVVMPRTGEITLWASDFNAGSFDNCTAKENLKFYFGNEDCTGPGEPSKTFTCKELGFQLLCIWVVDEAGNGDYCTTYVEIQDHSNPRVCSVASLLGLGGNVKTENAEPVQDVQVELKSPSGLPFQMITGNDGRYAFEGLQFNKNYQVVPARTGDWMNGVSTLDLVIIQQHVLGVKPLQSMYKLIAADIDHSSEVNVIDLVELRKLILGIYDKLPANPSWRFAEKSSTDNRYPYAIREIIEMKGLLQSGFQHDFVGIKIGDVNQSVTAHNLLGTESRNNEKEWVLAVDDLVLEPGQSYEVPFRNAIGSLLLGYQFTFGLDPQALEFDGYQSGSLRLDPSNFGFNHLDQGWISTSWNTEPVLSLQKDETLFTIRLKAKKKVRLSEVLSIHSKLTPAEAYSSTDETKAVRLMFTGSKQVTSKMVLHQNTPNPFKLYTLIGLELPQAGSAVLTITDISGKTLKAIRGDFGKGYHQIRVEKADLPASGVLYYRLAFGDQVLVKKMVVLE